MKQLTRKQLDAKISIFLTNKLQKYPDIAAGSALLRDIVFLKKLMLKDGERLNVGWSTQYRY